MRLFHSSLLAALLLLAGCSVPQKQEYTIVNQAIAMGDSTVYGLVCDGSNDSIIVFLNDPYDGSDPDTLDILDASYADRVFGTMRIGDRVAIIRDTADARKAAFVIVTQDLLGQWCYKEKPRLRYRPEGMDSLPDSIRHQIGKEHEFGMNIKIDSVVMPIGLREIAANSDEQSALLYPHVKRYRQWFIRNGQLLLTEMTHDSLDNRIPLFTDTADFVKLNADTLVLRFADGIRRYYRKEETEEQSTQR